MEDKFVPQSSSLDPFPFDEKEIVPGNHTRTVKPGSPHDLSYLVLRNRMLRRTPTARELELIEGVAAEPVALMARVSAAAQLSDVDTLLEQATELLGKPSAMPRVERALGLALLEDGRSGRVYRARPRLHDAIAQYKTKYDQFVQRFSIRRASMIKDQGVAKAYAVGMYADISPTFPPDGRPGLSVVRYVFLAGLKNEMEKGTGYGDYANRFDWRPCHPLNANGGQPVLSTPCLGETANSVATAAAKCPDFVELGDNKKALERVKFARALKNPVVIVVDPSSMAVPSLQSLATQLDSEPLPNSRLFVFRKAGDTGIPDVGFSARKARSEPIEDIGSHDEFKTALLSFFNESRGAMMASGEIPSAEPGGGSPPPTILKAS